MMVIERFYFSTVGHIKAIFLKKTLDKSIKIEGFALKMMTFFKEAFQVNRKSYPERVRSALFHAIKKTAANLDACVKVPGKDFSRKRKLPLQTMLLMLIGMGGGSLSKELYDWFGYTPSTATAYAITDVLWTPAFVMRKKGSYRKNKLFCLLAAAALRFVQSYLNDIASMRDSEIKTLSIMEGALLCHRSRN